MPAQNTASNAGCFNPLRTPLQLPSFKIMDF